MRISRAVVVTLVCIFTVSSAIAAEVPADVCSLLPPTQLEKTLGVPFATPEKNTAPAPFRGNPKGTQCEYAAQKGAAVKVVFIAYVDPSTALAKETFERLAMFYQAKSKPAVGDSAYFDKEDAIHVLKNRVRYYIAIEPTGTSKSEPYMSWASGSSSSQPAKEKVVKELAAAVAGKI